MQQFELALLFAVLCVALGSSEASVLPGYREIHIHGPSKARGAAN